MSQGEETGASTAGDMAPGDRPFPGPRQGLRAPTLCPPPAPHAWSNPAPGLRVAPSDLNR